MSERGPSGTGGTATCHCGRVVEPRDPDPWEGRMDFYCYDCATNRCDCYPDECPVKYPARRGPSGTGGTVRVYVPADEGPWDIEVWADPAALRSAYEPELRDDKMFDAPDDKLIRHVYEMNPDAPELRVEAEW